MKKSPIFRFLLSLLLFGISNLQSRERIDFCTNEDQGEYFYSSLKKSLMDNSIKIAKFDRMKNVPGLMLNNPTIFYNFPWEQQTPLSNAIIFLWEPPSVLKRIYDPDLLSKAYRIYTWDDDLVDNVRFFKFYYPRLQRMIPKLTPFSKKKLCTQVSANKMSSHPNQLYTEREEVIQFFESFPNNDFRFYGKWWEGCKYRSYGGAIENKIDTIKNYKFCICYENIRDIKGYITEKIFDCFAAGCVPVYWGASNIDEYIPEGSYIDRREFSSNEELYQFMKSMDRLTYKKYIQNIRKYLNSEEAQLFSWDTYIDIVTDAVKSLVPFAANHSSEKFVTGNLMLYDD